MKKCILYSFGFLVFTYATCCAQFSTQQLDSLLSRSLVLKDAYSAEKVANTNAIGTILLDQTISKATKNASINQFAKNLDSLAAAHIYSRASYALGQADIEYSLYFLNKGLPYVPQNNYKLLADYYGNIGVNYAIIGIDDIALKNLLKALEFIDLAKNAENNPIWVKKLLLSNICEIYLHQKNLTLAQQYFDASTALNKQLHKDSKFLYSKVIELNLAAEIAFLNNQKEKAKAHLKEGIQICKKIFDTDKQSELLSKLGEYQEDPKTKIAYLEKSYKIAHDNHGGSSFSINSCIKLIDTYLKQVDSLTTTVSNNYLKRAETLLENLETEITIRNSKKDLSEIYRLKASMYAKVKNYEKAFTYSEAHHRLNDSIFSQENKNKLAALQSATEIQLRDQEIATNKNIIKAKEHQNWILFTGLFIVSFLVGALWYQNNLRKKKNRKLKEANHIKTQFFNIINHDLRSPIGDLIRFLHLQKEHPEIMDNATKERLDNQTLEAVENLLISMEDLLLWSKGQMKNFQPEYKKIHVYKLFQDIEKNYLVTNNVTITFETSEQIRLITDKNYLKTIIRNLTTNAIKALTHTENATIVWRAFETKTSIILSITDNGTGANEAQFKALYNVHEVVGTKDGLGLHLVRDMANAIQAKVEVQSIINHGTTIRIIFKK